MMMRYGDFTSLFIIHINMETPRCHHPREFITHVSSLWVHDTVHKLAKAKLFIEVVVVGRSSCPMPA
jgi:hypothetical protein